MKPVIRSDNDSRPKSKSGPLHPRFHVTIDHLEIPVHEDTTASSTGYLVLPHRMTLHIRIHEVPKCQPILAMLALPDPRPPRR